MEVIFLAAEGRDRPSFRVRCAHFGAELERRGHRVRVVSLAERMGVRGDELYRISERRKVQQALELFPELVRRRPTILVLQKVGFQILAPLLARWAVRHPLVLDYDDWDLQYQPFRTLRLVPGIDVRRLTGWVARRAELRIAASAELEEWLAVLAPGKRVQRIETGVDHRRFTPPPGREVRRPIRFLWTGLLWGDPVLENLCLVLRAMARLNPCCDAVLEVRGELFGYGPQIESLARRLGLEGRVELAGWTPPEAMPAVLRRCDVGLFPLASRDAYSRCKSPTKLFEFMAAGMAVIASDLGEAPSVLDEGRAGLLAADEEEMAAAMERLIREPELREELGRVARRRVEERYCLEVLVRRLEQGLQTVWETAA